MALVAVSHFLMDESLHATTLELSSIEIIGSLIPPIGLIPRLTPSLIFGNLEPPAFAFAKSVIALLVSRLQRSRDPSTAIVAEIGHSIRIAGVWSDPFLE
jgi:hypothetical protein